MIKQNKELIKKLKPYWAKLNEFEAYHNEKIYWLEKKINKELKPKVELDFFRVDGEIVGIGARDMEYRKDFALVHRDELEEK